MTCSLSVLQTWNIFNQGGDALRSLKHHHNSYYSGPLTLFHSLTEISFTATRKRNASVRACVDVVFTPTTLPARVRLWVWYQEVFIHHLGVNLFWGSIHLPYPETETHKAIKILSHCRHDEDTLSYRRATSVAADDLTTQWTKISPAMLLI